MTPLKPTDINWTVSPPARGDIESVLSNVKPYWYQQAVDALREDITAFVNAEPGCLHRQSSSIMCIGATTSGAKVLKVRCALPGTGKSGGLRIGLTADCKGRKISVVYAAVRKDEPDTGLMLARAEAHTGAAGGDSAR